MTQISHTHNSLGQEHDEAIVQCYNEKYYIFPTVIILKSIVITQSKKPLQGKAHMQYTL